MRKINIFQRYLLKNLFNPKEDYLLIGTFTFKAMIFQNLQD